MTKVTTVVILSKSTQVNYACCPRCYSRAKKKKKVGCAENGERVDEMKAGFLQVSLSPEFSAY